MAESNNNNSADARYTTFLENFKLYPLREKFEEYVAMEEEDLLRIPDTIHFETAKRGIMSLFKKINSPMADLILISMLATGQDGVRKYNEYSQLMGKIPLHIMDIFVNNNLMSFIGTCAVMDASMHKKLLSVSSSIGEGRSMTVIQILKTRGMDIVSEGKNFKAFITVKGTLIEEVGATKGAAVDLLLKNHPNVAELLNVASGKVAERDGIADLSIASRFLQTKRITISWRREEPIGSDIRYSLIALGRDEALGVGKTTKEAKQNAMQDYIKNTNLWEDFEMYYDEELAKLNEGEVKRRHPNVATSAGKAGGDKRKTEVPGGRPGVRPMETD